jgi:hypothetical protein
MRVNLNLLPPLPMAPYQEPPPSTASALPRLWPQLQPTQRHQLTQCLAELIQRQRRAAVTRAEEATHEPR